MEQKDYFSDQLLEHQKIHQNIELDSLHSDRNTIEAQNEKSGFNNNIYNELLEISDDEFEKLSQISDSDDSLIILTQEQANLEMAQYANKAFKDRDYVQEVNQQEKKQEQIKTGNGPDSQILSRNYQKESIPVVNTVYNPNPYSVETYDANNYIQIPPLQYNVGNNQISNVYSNIKNIPIQNNIKYYQNPYKNVILIDDQTITNLPAKYPDRPLPWKKPDNFGTSSNPIDLSVDSLDHSFSYNPYYSIIEYQDSVPQKLYNSSPYPQVFDTSREIMALLDNIQPVDELKVKEGTLKRLLPTLMEHQKIGLTWMKEREEGSNKGGILADDMGLGKTIQALALIVSQKENGDGIGTTLICTPVSLLQQWAREIQTKTKPPLKFYIHHGNSKRAIKSSEINKYDIVLTTYGTIAHDYKNSVKYEKNATENPKYMFYKSPFTLLDHQWHRIILDEAQVIKNRHTLSALSCCKLEATYRWCLSGTPMQNSIDELYSLMRFLRIRPYDDWSTFSDHFSRHFNRYSSSSSIKECMRKLQVLLKATLLRRTKFSTINGKPLLKLLPKNMELVHVVFSNEELVFYKKLEEHSQLQMSQYVNENVIGSHYTNLLVLLLRLRQACDHRWLVRIEESIEMSETDFSNQKSLALKIFPQQVENIRRLKDFECHVCYEIILSPNFIVPCGHYYCRDCIFKVIEQNQKMAIMNGDITSDARCPECRCLFNLKKIVDFSVFRKVYSWNYESSFTQEQKEISDEETDEDLTVIKDKGKQKAVLCDNRSAINNLDTKLAWKKIFDHKVTKQTRNKFQEKLKNKNFESSAKINKCIEILDKIKHENNLEKTIVFSQFVEFLDLLEIPLFLKGYKVLRYDGRMSATHRDESLLKFDQDPTQTVMLISLKAGNAGLNLTSASQCILLDPFWNPFVEEQAINRIHRIGQTRPVQVYKLIVEGTVEQRVLDLQKRKRDLIENALEENASMQISRLNKQELSFLFGLQNN
ncbi:uncharacterized protein T551_00873 [Pneumocystis jirovecii RU7]|uniref:Uncharacterized protein n=1 Tax=Pneumocystis jirovecii (strain RU7) TaxID=1408657 RepID=A0A0W4ZUZ8_PNEJ7|nr:uncharacterized protein T551_00873 [Pneumocystis jirovecii RU7]KTW32191.1 hypothetical protein T551_00873 [Pneumocystis jirovecii RU7]